jgi:drug/metabolite transporter (DMT)-like permease
VILLKPRNLYRIIIGALMIISGIVFILQTSGEGIPGTIFLCAGLAFLITGLSRHRKYADEPESDERSKKIGAYGLSYAWLTGLLFMFGLFWLDYLGLFRLSTQNALSASILILTLSAVLYQTYLFHRGDIG